MDTVLHVALQKPPRREYVLTKPAACSRVGLTCRDAGVSAAIEAVAPGSIAARACLQVGDHIVSINGEVVVSGAHVRDIISGLDTRVVITAFTPLGLNSGNQVRHWQGIAKPRPVIVHLIPGTVAASSDLRVGDQILTINDDEVFDKTDVAERLRAAQGEVVVEVSPGPSKVPRSNKSQADRRLSTPRSVASDSSSDEPPPGPSGSALERFAAADERAAKLTQSV